MADFFLNVYRLIHGRKKMALGAVLLLFGILFWMVSTIKFDEDISKLIPHTSENKELQHVLGTAKFVDKIVVHLHSEPEGTADDLTDYATRFLDSLTGNSEAYITHIQGQIEDETIFKTLDFVYDHVPLFLGESDYKQISAKLAPDSLAKIMENNYKTLISPSGIVAKKTLIKDPLGISLLGLKQLQQLGISDGFTLRDGFLVSKDNRHLLLFITPKFPSNNTTENAIFTAQLYTLQDQLNGVFQDKVSSSYFGGPLIAVANAAQIKSDIQVTVTIAMVLLMAIFILFYKKFTIPVILFVPTLFGGLLAIAFLSIIRDEISAISLGIGAVLLGVTLDYSLHILTHIRNKETVEELFTGISKPILMSSITTALAFLCLIFVDAQALQDLGIFAAISVMGASVFALVFMPQVYHGTSEETSKSTFFDALAAYPFHKNKILLGGIAGLLIMSAYTYHRVLFNKDLSNLNFQPEAIISAEAGLDTLINVSSKSLYAIAFGTDEQQVLETNDAIFQKLQRLESDRTIAGFNSVAALVASRKKQEEAITDWDKFWTSDRKSTTTAQLLAQSKTLGFKPSTFQEFYDLLNRKFQPLTIADYKETNIIPVSEFIAEEAGFMTITSVITLDDEQIGQVRKEFKNTPNLMLIDRQAINETLLGHIKTDFNQVLVYCFIAVVVLLLLFYKNLKLTLVTLLPIIITWFITVGIMGLFHLEFNIFNIIISSFIFGLGVDYSIFMTTGMRSGVSSMKTHKTSIILSVVTTVLGVGVLIFAKHPALHSLATISIIGIVSAMLITFTLQPILHDLLLVKKTAIPHQKKDKS